MSRYIYSFIINKTRWGSFGSRDWRVEVWRKKVEDPPLTLGVDGSQQQGRGQHGRCQRSPASRGSHGPRRSNSRRCLWSLSSRRVTCTNLRSLRSTERGWRCSCLSLFLYFSKIPSLAYVIRGKRKETDAAARRGLLDAPVRFRLTCFKQRASRLYSWPSFGESPRRASAEGCYRPGETPGERGR